MNSYLEGAIHAGSIVTVVFCFILFLIMRKYGAPTKIHDGFLDVSATDASQIFQLDITTEPEKLKDQERVIFKVRKIEPPS